MRRGTIITGLLTAVWFSGCVYTHLYGHNTIEGARFPFERLESLHEGMSNDDVHAALGEPLEVTNSGGLSMWRYFERANPRWCDGGSSKAVPPEYSIEAILVFEQGTLAIKKVSTKGTPAAP